MCQVNQFKPYEKKQRSKPGLIKQKTFCLLYNPVVNIGLFLSIIFNQNANGGKF